MRVYCAQSMDFSLDAWLSAAGAAVGALSLAFIPLVLIRKKEASSTFAWILVLLFLPVVGVTFFWFLGRNRVRRPVRLKSKSNVQVRDRLEDALSADGTSDSLQHQSIEQKGIMQLATKLGRSRIWSGSKVEVLVNAEDAYQSQIDAINEAHDHIHLEYYILRGDAQGTRFLQALVAAAGRGVRVRVLYDAFGSRGLTRRYLKPLLKAGGYAAPFLPLDPIRKAWTINLRNHRKLMVVDGTLGFTGGMNIGEEFLDWRDIKLRIQGPAVKGLQTVFVEDWFFATRHNLVDPEFFPQLEPAGASMLQIVQSGPDATLENIHRVYFAAIASAQHSVSLATPYFVPDKAILTALQTAALRGVEVNVLLPSRSNHQVTFYAGRSFYEELLETGVQIHEYQEGMLHQKMMIVDRHFATVGSANFDLRSFRLNFELIALLYDPELVSKLDMVLTQDMARSMQISLGDWRARPFRARVAEGFGRLCSPIL